jgi:hypothetical protein
MAVEVHNLVFRFIMQCKLVSAAATQQSAASIFTPQSRTAASQQSAASIFNPQSRTAALQQSAASILTPQSRTAATQQSAASICTPQSRTAASQQSAASIFTPQSRTAASQQSAASIFIPQSRTYVFLWCHLRPISGYTIPNGPAPSLPLVICGRHWLTALFRYPSVILIFPIHSATFVNFLDYTLIMKAINLIERLLSISFFSRSLYQGATALNRLDLHHDVPRSHSRQITLKTDHTQGRLHSRQITLKADHTQDRSHSRQITLKTDHTQDRSHSRQIALKTDHTQDRSHSARVLWMRHRPIAVTST